MKHSIYRKDAIRLIEESKGKIFTVAFIKKGNGENRIMTARNGVKIGVKGILPKGKRKEEDKDAQREAMAKKIGFTAYAESKDMPDPVQNGLESVLDHLHKLEKELEELKKNKSE